MTKISRRELIVDAIAVPILAPATSAVVVPACPPLKIASDNLVEKAAEWIAADEHLTALELRWQALESQLFDKARRMKMSCDKATRSNMPEAQAMRAIDREIEDIHRRLAASADEVSQTPSATIAGAIAKIELGLKVQGPYDWRDHAQELLENGIAELRAIIRDGRAAEFSSFR
jgi:hypothetical protein